MFADSALIIKSYEKYSYKELLKVRDDLVEDMRNFENDRFPPDLWHRMRHMKLLRKYLWAF